MQYKIPKEIEGINYLKKYFINEMNQINKSYSIFSRELLINFIFEYGFKKIESEEYNDIYKTTKELIDELTKSQEINEKALNKIIDESR